MESSQIYYDPFSGNILVWDKSGENWIVQPTDQDNVERHWYLKEFMWSLRSIKILADEQIAEIFKNTGITLEFNE
tara:strand:+ start:634 stop:858 length:225 start_codon:yes stop_codon:yes gene_type:complete